MVRGDAVLLLLLLSAPGGTAMAQRPVVPTTAITGTLRFDARATLGRFTGTTAAVTGALVGGPGLETVSGWIEFPVDSLATGNGLRDRDMRASLDAEGHPTIRFDLTAVRPGATPADTMVVLLLGAFTIRGVRREVNLPATLTWSERAVRVEVLHTMDVRDYRVDRLTKLFGTLRMEPEIVVRVDLILGQEPP